ncbi:MAG TPA: DUF5110 domain-containing protein, partial [Lachnospiraceae bacterium]|nr:DUF5110 domain-containing protein [Lachnospiraceae bacterium]
KQLMPVSNPLFSLIRFLWHENEKMLQIMPREGTYDGMQTERDFIIEVLGRQIKTLHYTGSELSVLIHDNPAD